MGHPGEEPLTHLKNACKGIQITEKGASDEISRCEACQLTKAQRMISRHTDKEEPIEAPLARVLYDLIKMNRGYNGEK